jgi:hypothetical protein
MISSGFRWRYQGSAMPGKYWRISEEVVAIWVRALGRCCRVSSVGVIERAELVSIGLVAVWSVVTAVALEKKPRMSR